MLAKAILIAAQAHLNQKSRRGRPYVLHPLRVMSRFQSEADMIVAVLHDVVEDSPDWSLDRLRDEGFSDETIAAIDHLTRRTEETYEAFIERAGKNSLARGVKIADLEDNMDIKRLQTLTGPDKDRLEKYHKAWVQLSR